MIIFMPNLMCLSYKVCVYTNIQPERHDSTNSASDQEYFYLLMSATPLTENYLHLHKLSIPFFDHFNWSKVHQLSHYHTEALDNAKASNWLQKHLHTKCKLRLLYPLPIGYTRTCVRRAWTDTSFALRIACRQHCFNNLLRFFKTSGIWIY